MYDSVTLKIKTQRQKRKDEAARCDAEGNVNDIEGGNSSSKVKERKNKKF